MLNVTNQAGKHKSRWPKDNLRWPKGNSAETIELPDLYITATAWGRCDRPASAADTFCDASTLAAAWLIGLPRRAGRRLFAINDTEAGWRAGRSPRPSAVSADEYRDARWDALAADPLAAPRRHRRGHRPVQGRAAGRRLG